MLSSGGYFSQMLQFLTRVREWCHCQVHYFILQWNTMVSCKAQQPVNHTMWCVEKRLSMLSFSKWYILGVHLCTSVVSMHIVDVVVTRIKGGSVTTAWCYECICSTEQLRPSEGNRF